MKHHTTRQRVPYIVAMVVSIVVWVWQVVGWATTACQIPNQSQVFCVGPSNSAVAQCSEYNNSYFCSSHFLQERVLFPQGTVKSTSGTTSQVVTDCWRKQACISNPNTFVCTASGTWGAWNLADKTIVGTNTCPTEED